jgi:hypothetical protein
MWESTGGPTYFHAFTRYKIGQLELRGMTPEQFDSLRVFVARQDERTAHDSGMTLGQLTGRHHDDDPFEVVHPGTGRKHAVLDVDKQLEDGRITFTVDSNPSPN